MQTDRSPAGQGGGTGKKRARPGSERPLVARKPPPGHSKGQEAAHRHTVRRSACTFPKDESKSSEERRVPGRACGLIAGSLQISTARRRSVAVLSGNRKKRLTWKRPLLSKCARLLWSHRSLARLRSGGRAGALARLAAGGWPSLPVCTSGVWGLPEKATKL